MGVDIHRSWVGEHATSLEMAGASITCLKLDGELQILLDRPCHAVAFDIGDASAPPARLGRSAKLGHRSIGHADPGAASTAFMLDAMAKAIRTVR